MLSRAQNHWSPEMYGYINKPDRMIVVYDLDEKIATRAAETFVQRGVDNVFLLSGGTTILPLPESVTFCVLFTCTWIGGRHCTSCTFHSSATYMFQLTFSYLHVLTLYLLPL